MPTGFTQPIYNGKDMSLKNFALRCITNFGAGYEASDGGSKDLPLDMPPKLQVDDFYYNRIKDAEAKLKKLKELKKSPDKLLAAYEKECASRVEHVDIVRKDRAEIERNLNKMMAKVNSWHVSSEFSFLKEYMKKQINECIEHDCKYYVPPVVIKPQPMDEWINEQIEFAKESVADYKKRAKKEAKRIQKLNEYFERLYAELNKFEETEE